jgi:hypothetical protein
MEINQVTVRLRGTAPRHVDQSRHRLRDLLPRDVLVVKQAVSAS